MSWRLLAPLTVMAVIFALSAQTGGDELAWWEVAMRKLAHFGIYATLGAAWFWALAGRVERPLAWACVISLAYACTDEFHQTFVDGRNGTPVDVLIDGVGIAAAALVIHLSRFRAARSPA